MSNETKSVLFLCVGNEETLTRFRTARDTIRGMLEKFASEGVA